MRVVLVLWLGVVMVGCDDETVRDFKATADDGARLACTATLLNNRYGDQRIECVIWPDTLSGNGRG